MLTVMNPVQSALLDPKITSRVLPVNDLDIHILEYNAAIGSTLPLAIFLHGFPELAFSWRKILSEPSLNSKYHLVAPDIRGYGLTTTREPKLAPNAQITYDQDIGQFQMSNLVDDVIGLVRALGYTECHVVGHDFGSPLAGYCSLIRPDVFKSVVLMSAPFTGPPPPQSDSIDPQKKSRAIEVNEELGKLAPSRKHYAVYFSSREANRDMSDPLLMPSFLRAYYHVKSGQWRGNDPHPLQNSIAAMAELPAYYVMPIEQTMPEIVASFAPSEAEISSCDWLTDDELSVYVSTFIQTGFQGGLNHYRCATDDRWSKQLSQFYGQQVQVPAMFLSGKNDWGVYQLPGAVDTMRHKICKQMQDKDFILLDGAGHWVQQEKSVDVARHLLRFWHEV